MRFPLLAAAIALTGVWRCWSSSETTVEINHKRAIEMGLSGDYDAALESLQSIVHEHPSAQYLNDLGVTYLRKVVIILSLFLHSETSQRDFFTAQRIFQRALDLDPNYEVSTFIVHRSSSLAHRSWPSSIFKMLRDI
jgi:tetratricopeptide (TPR) repeat protein